MAVTEKEYHYHKNGKVTNPSKALYKTKCNAKLKKDKAVPKKTAPKKKVAKKKAKKSKK